MPTAHVAPIRRPAKALTLKAVDSIPYPIGSTVRRWDICIFYPDGAGRENVAKRIRKWGGMSMDGLPDNILLHAVDLNR